MKHSILAALFSGLWLVGSTLSAQAEPLAVGKEIPAALKSTDTEDKAFDVTAYLKQGTTLVFFFPKANTGG
ncbi:MAG: hypothetical protein AAF514_14010 [Verrucomicrobiota bacterium]